LSVQVSVVVPTYKRPDLLRKCLDALVKQQFPPDDYEIIIVDDGCSEETRILVESFSAEPEQAITGPASRSRPQTGFCPLIRYAAATGTHGPAAARNLGWRMARGEFIAFTDDDCLPDPHWLEEGLAALKRGFDAVSGQVIVPILDSPTDNEITVSRLAVSEFVTANCFCRRSALEATGGFDERFTLAWREDSDLHFHLLELQCRLGKAPAARVIHPVRQAPWGVSIREQRKSIFNALLYKKYPNLYKQRIQSLPPLRYYAIVLSAIGVQAALLMGTSVLAVGLALLWAGLTLQFALMRLRETRHDMSHILEMLYTSIFIPPLSIFWRLYGAVRFRVLFF
jgi:glycosyltransferase involved in cell wall biosynthesis